MRPRVWFGERWITSIFDQFEENVRYFPALLPVCDDEDPVAVLDRGDTPTARRAADAQRHHLPLEPAGLRRVPGQTAPAGREPGAAGRPDRRRRPGQRRLLLRAVARAGRRRTDRCGRRCRSPPPPTTSRPVPATASTPSCTGPGSGEVPATELVLRRLLPLAHQGLSDWGVDSAVSDRLLGIIEQRCTTHQNGAEWQARTFHRIEEQQATAGPARLAARDAPPLRRAHAQQRAGPHLAGRLTHIDGLQVCESLHTAGGQQRFTNPVRRACWAEPFDRR